MAAAILGGGQRIQTAKFHIYNSDSAVDYAQASVNLINSLDDGPGGSFNVSVTSDNAADNNTYKARIIGWDTTGSPQPQQDDNLVMNGTTPAPSGLNWSKVVAIESRDVSSGALKPTNGNWTVKYGSTVYGVLLAGKYSMTSEVRIGLVATLSDTTTVADAATLPGGISLSKPRTVLTGIAMANSGVLTHLQTQGGWSVWAVDEMRKVSSDLQVIIMTDGAFYS
jgi:hypothetical protein